MGFNDLTVYPLVQTLYFHVIFHIVKSKNMTLLNLLNVLNIYTNQALSPSSHPSTPLKP